MRARFRLSAFSAIGVLLFAACAPSDDAERQSGEAASPSAGGEASQAADREASAAQEAANTVPTSADELFEYLKAGTYRSFAHEAAPHASTGPHPSPDLQPSSTVQAFFNAPMNASLLAGDEFHPVGAAIVKEFRDDQGSLSGWAVSVKTGDSSTEGGDAWYWYEIIGTADGGTPVADGNGVGLCWGCHIAGRDFVLSRYP